MTKIESIICNIIGLYLIAVACYFFCIAQNGIQLLITFAMFLSGIVALIAAGIPEIKAR